MEIRNPQEIRSPVLIKLSLNGMQSSKQGINTIQHPPECKVYGEATKVDNTEDMMEVD